MTLLEQLVSLVLCSILLVAAVGSYRTVSFGAKSLAANAEVHDEVRQTLDLLSDDLLLAYLDNDKCKLDTKPQRMSSEDEIILQLCTTANPLENKSSGIQQVQYVQKKKDSSGSKLSLVRLTRPVKIPGSYEWKPLLLTSDMSEIKIRDVSSLHLIEVKLTVELDEEKQSATKVCSYSYNSILVNGVADGK